MLESFSRKDKITMSMINIPRAPMEKVEHMQQ